MQRLSNVSDVSCEVSNLGPFLFCRLLDRDFAQVARQLDLDVSPS
jgi:hypothetical protein